MHLVIQFAHFICGYYVHVSKFRYVRQFSKSHPEVFADESVVAAIINETFVGHNFLFGFKVPSVRRDRGGPASLDMIRSRAEGRQSSVVAWQMLFPSTDHSFTTVMARFNCFVRNIDSNHSMKNRDFYERSLSHLSAADLTSKSAYEEKEFDVGRLAHCSLQSIALSCDQRIESSGKQDISVGVVQPTYNNGSTITWDSLESPDRCHSPFITDVDSHCGLKILTGLAIGNIISSELTKSKRKRVSCLSRTSLIEPRNSLRRKSVKRCTLDLDGSLLAVNFPSFQEQIADMQKRLDFKRPLVNSELADIGSKIGGDDEQLEMPYSEDLDEFLAKGELKEEGRSLLDIQPGLTVCLDIKHFTDCTVSSAANEIQKKYLDCSIKGRLDSRDSSVELFPDLTDNLIEQSVERSQVLRAILISCRPAETIQTRRFKFANETGNASPEINFSPISNQALCDSLVPHFAFGSDLKAKSSVRLNCRHPQSDENFICVTPVNAAKVFPQKKVCDRLSRLSAAWRTKPLSALRNSENLRTTLGKILTSRRANKKSLDEKSFDLFPSPHVCTLNFSRKDAVHSCSTPVVKFPASSTPLSRPRAHKNFEKVCGHSASEILESSDCILHTPIENDSRAMKNYKTCWNKPYVKIRLASAGSHESCDCKDRGRKSTDLCSQDLFSYSSSNQISDAISPSVCEAAKHPLIPYSGFDNKPLQQSMKCPNDNSQALGDSEELFSNSDDLFAE